VFAIAPMAVTANGYFVLASTPGAVLKRRVKVTNVGDSAGNVRLYAVDATTGRTTGAVYLGADRPRLDVGAWIDLKQAGVRLAPRQSKTIAFTVRVPKQVRGGQHLGGIVADNVSFTKGKSKTKNTDGSFKIDLHHLTITAVQVNLPARPANSMAIEGLRADGRPGYQNVLVDMASRGNQMIKPTLDIEVKDDGGKRVLRRITRLDSFLPATRIDYPVAVLGRGLAAGTYKGTVVLRLGGKILDRFSGSFEVTDKQVAQVFGEKDGPTAPGARLPWKTILAGALAALLAAAAALGIRSIRRRRAAAVELARLDLEVAASRLRDLEDRESGVAERERIDTVRRQLLEEKARDLDDLEQASTHRTGELEGRESNVAERERVDSERKQAFDERDRDLHELEQASTHRAREVERTELVLVGREVEETARCQELEQRQIRVAEREQAAALRVQELERNQLRLVEREAQEAACRQELHDGERRLREREEEASARRVQSGIEEATSRQALVDRELRLREREEAHRLHVSMTRKRRSSATLADRLRRRIGA
jgi:hypothetical protein